jgi:hypothetical protein
MNGASSATYQASSIKTLIAVAHSRIQCYSYNAKDRPAPQMAM